MEWYTWFSILGGSTLLGAIVMDIYARIKYNGKKVLDKNKKEKEEKEQKIISDIVDKSMETVKKDIAQINTKLDGIKTDLDSNKSATVTGLRTDLMILRDRFRDQGFASRNDKAAWEQLYKEYTQFGGNHFKEYVNQWRDEVEELPTD